MLNKLAFYLLCFIIWFAPIPLGANRPWAWGIVELLICINTLLICFNHNFQDIFKRLKPIRYILSTIFIVQIWVFLQWIGQYNADLSVFGLGTFDLTQTEISLIKGISFCLFIINLAFLLNSTLRIKQLCWIIMLAGLTQAVYAIFLQYSGWESSILGLEIGPRASGSFVYQNHLANYLLLCLSVAIGYLIGSLEGIEATTNKHKLISIIETLLSTKWVVRISIIIMVVALIMTRSRMGNSAFFVSLLVSSVFALILMKRPANTLKWLIVSLIVLDMVIVGTYFGVEKVKERLEATSYQSETRNDVVQDAIPYIQDYIFTGTGAGSFYSSFLQYQSTEYKDFYDHAHNEYVEFSAELGIIPSLFLFAIVLSVIWKCLKTLRTSHRKFNSGMAMGCLMACIGMMMHCTVDFILQDYAIVILFLTVLSVPFLLNATDIKKTASTK